MPVTSYLRSKICLPLPSRQPQLKTLTLLQQLTMKAVFHEFDNRSPAASRRFLSFSPSLSLSLSREVRSSSPFSSVFPPDGKSFAAKTGFGRRRRVKKKKKKKRNEGRKEEKIPVTIARSSVSLAWGGTETLEAEKEEEKAEREGRRVNFPRP